MHGMPTAVQIAGRLVLFIRLAPDAQLVALGDDFALFGTKAGALHVQAGWRSGGAQSLARHRISVSRVFCLGKKAPLLERGPSVLLVWLRKRKPFRRPRSPFGPREYVHDMIRFTRVNGDAVSLPLAALPWRGRICGEGGCPPLDACKSSAAPRLRGLQAAAWPDGICLRYRGAMRGADWKESIGRRRYGTSKSSAGLKVDGDFCEGGVACREATSRVTPISRSARRNISRKAMKNGRR